MQERVDFFRIKYGLSEQSAVVLDLLMERNVSGYNTLKEAGVAEPYMAIKRLRRAVKTLGVAIDARYGMGYVLTDDSKKLLTDAFQQWQDSEHGRTV